MTCHQYPGSGNNNILHFFLLYNNLTSNFIFHRYLYEEPVINLEGITGERDWRDIWFRRMWTRRFDMNSS